MPVATAQTYSGVFQSPPAALLAGANGWTFDRETDPDNPGKWRPRAWVIIYPDHMIRVDYRTRLIVRDTSIFAV